MQKRQRVISLSGLLARAGITEACVIRELGINRRTWESWLWGMSEPNETHREQLSRLLDCPVSDIHAAIGQNRERWVRIQLGDESLGREEKKALPTWTEILVQVIVSIITSVIVTMKLLRKV